MQGDRGEARQHTIPLSRNMLDRVAQHSPNARSQTYVRAGGDAHPIRGALTALPSAVQHWFAEVNETCHFLLWHQGASRGPAQHVHTYIHMYAHVMRMYVCTNVRQVAGEDQRPAGHPRGEKAEISDPY